MHRAARLPLSRATQANPRCITSPEQFYGGQNASAEQQLPQTPARAVVNILLWDCSRRDPVPPADPKYNSCPKPCKPRILQGYPGEAELAPAPHEFAARSRAPGTAHSMQRRSMHVHTPRNHKR